MTEYSQIRHIPGPTSFGFLNIVPGLTRILDHDLLIMDNCSKANLINKNIMMVVHIPVHL